MRFNMDIIIDNFKGRFVTEIKTHSFFKSYSIDLAFVKLANPDVQTALKLCTKADTLYYTIHVHIYYMVVSC